MGQTPILPAVAQNIIRFSTAPSLTDDLATEGEVAREDYDFFVRTVNECGGIDITGKNYEVDIEIVYCDDCIGRAATVCCLGAASRAGHDAAQRGA